jgi:hypothetical protein
VKGGAQVPELAILRVQPFLKGVELTIVAKDLYNHPDRQDHEYNNQKQDQQYER